MKQFTIVFLFFLFTFSGFSAKAQSPGFLGKHTSINLHFTAFPAFFGPTANNKGRSSFFTGSGNTGWNYEYKLSIEQAVGRYTALSLTAGQYHTGLVTNARTLEVESNQFGSTSYDKHELFYQLNINSLSVRWQKFFRDKGALAPIGDNWFFGYKHLFVSGDIIDKRTIYVNGFPKINRNLNIDDTQNFHVLFVGLNKTHAIGKRFLFRIGTTLGIMLDPQYIFTSTDLKINEHYFDGTNTQKYRIRAFDRLRRQEFINVEVGVGYLLF